MDPADIVEGGITNTAFVENELDGGMEDPQNGNSIAMTNTKASRSSKVAPLPEIRTGEREPETKDGCNMCGVIPLPFFKVFLKAPWILLFLCWASTIQVGSFL